MTDRGGIRKGQEWARDTNSSADLRVAGSDAALAASALQNPGALIEFAPSVPSDLGATLGNAPTSPPQGMELEIDLLLLGEQAAVGWILIGCAPARTRRWHRRQRVELVVDGRRQDITVTGIVALNAQHLGGSRISCRGHPGDGRGEVQWFGLAPRDRAAMRRRLPSADHLGHSLVGTASFRELLIRSRHKMAIQADGNDLGHGRAVEIRVIPGAFRLLI